MDAETRNELARMNAEIQRLQRHTLNIPSRIGRNAETTRRIQIVSGNILPATGYDGIKRVTVLPSSVVALDLLTLPATVDGIGYGRDVYTSELLLIAHGPPSGIKWDLSVHEGPIECFQQYAIEITGAPGTYQNFWIPGAWS